MTTVLDPKQIIPSEELLVSQIVSQEALTRLLITNGLFTKREFSGMAKVVDREMKREKL